MFASFLIAAIAWCAIAGTVRSATGVAVARARIVLSGPARVETRSRPDGSFALAAAAGTYDVSVAAPGFAAAALRGVRVHDGLSLAVVLEAVDAAAPRTIASIAVDGRLARAREEVPSQRVARAELDALGATLALDALAVIPAVTVVRPGGGNRSAVAVAALRGPDPSETLVALDGQTLNDAVTGDFDLAAFPVAPLARVDVAEGLGPAEHRAANTIGGEIDLHTLGPTSTARTAFATSYGSFGTRSFAAQATGRRGPVGYAFAGSADDAAGFVRGEGSFGGTPVALGAATEARSALATLTYEPSARAGLRARYFTLADRRDESAALDAPLDAARDGAGEAFAGPGAAFATQGLRALLLSGRVPLGAGALVTSYALSGTTTTFDGGPTASPYATFANDRLATLTLGYERTTADTDLSVGVSTRGERLDGGAAFAGDVQRARSQGVDTRYAFRIGPRARVALQAFESHYSTFGRSRDGRIGASYDLDARSVVRASVGTGFRAPLLAERFALSSEALRAAGPGALDEHCVAANGNPAERAEHVTAYEIGYGRALAGDASLDLSAYRTNLRDPIEIAYPLGARCPANAPPSLQAQAIPINAGRAVYAGGEARLTRRLGPLELRAAYGLDLARPTDLPAIVANPTSGANLVVGRQFEGIPIATGSLGASYERGGFHAAARLSFAARNNALQDGPYAFLDGALGERVGPVDVTLAFRNLTSAEAGKFTRLGLGLPYATPFAPGGALRTDRSSVEPAAFALGIVVRP